MYNPLNIAREDLVEADLPVARLVLYTLSGPDGKARPAQLEGGKVLFSAKAPSVGYAVYDVAPAGQQCSA